MKSGKARVPTNGKCEGRVRLGKVRFGKGLGVVGMGWAGLVMDWSVSNSKIINASPPEPRLYLPQLPPYPSPHTLSRTDRRKKKKNWSRQRGVGRQTDGRHVGWLVGRHIGC